MKITTNDTMIIISDGGESINLELNHDTKKVHIWITLPNGGMSITVLQFTPDGIQVV